MTTRRVAIFNSKGEVEIFRFPSRYALDNHLACMRSVTGYLWGIGEGLALYWYVHSPLWEVRGDLYDDRTSTGG